VVQSRCDAEFLLDLIKNALNLTELVLGISTAFSDALIKSVAAQSTQALG
jgi:hypothetical protein